MGSVQFSEGLSLLAPPVERFEKGYPFSEVFLVELKLVGWSVGRLGGWVWKVCGMQPQPSLREALLSPDIACVLCLGKGAWEGPFV